MARVGLVQLCSGDQVDANLAAAEGFVTACAAAGAKVVMLPEAFAYLGPAAGRVRIAEALDAPGPILQRCQDWARDLGVHVVLGGFPEACDDSHTYNTAVHIDSHGALGARYRKVHLFDVDLADGTRLDESTSTAAGDRAVVTDLPCGRTGLSICYDMRFPGLYQQLVDAGAEVLIAPSAFTATTGAAHWEVLLRARAIECQAFMLAPAQTGAHGHGRVSFGHTIAIDPWGRVLLDLGEAPGYGVLDIDHAVTTTARTELPSLRHRRPFAPPAAWPTGNE